MEKPSRCRLIENLISFPANVFSHFFFVIRIRRFFIAEIYYSFIPCDVIWKLGRPWSLKACRKYSFSFSFLFLYFHYGNGDVEWNLAWKKAESGVGFVILRLWVINLFLFIFVINDPNVLFYYCFFIRNLHIHILIIKLVFFITHCRIVCIMPRLICSQTQDFLLFLIILLMNKNLKTDFCYEDALNVFFSNI